MRAAPFRFDSEAHYQEDLADLKAKYLQTIDAGVRQIALLADDSTDWGRLYGNEATYLRILNDLTSWIHELQALRDADGTPRYATLGVLALRKGFQRRWRAFPGTPPSGRPRELLSPGGPSCNGADSRAPPVTYTPVGYVHSFRLRTREKVLLATAFIVFAGRWLGSMCTYPAKVYVSGKSVRNR